MDKNFIEIIEPGENLFSNRDVYMCRNKDYKDPYFESNKPMMCRNKDYKDPYMESVEILNKVA